MGRTLSFFPTALRPALVSMLLIVFLITAPGRGLADHGAALEEITVHGVPEPFFNTHYASSSTLVTPNEIGNINAATVEDVIKYEPGLAVRRRYIGDPNGTLGMRGSNMFQTTRSMVFADGLPLHYLLQTQFSGSPRWSLVSPDETQAVEVVYGPFSAEYGGNAMGGVVNIETELSTERALHMEGSVFEQHFDTLYSEEGAGKVFDGSRAFLSYGDHIGNFSVYTFLSHLENESQPMTFFFDNTGMPAGTETAVNGAAGGADEYGNEVVYYGDAGSEEVVTDLAKLKLGYTFENWVARLTVAHEGRESLADSPNNYLTLDNGTAFWDGNARANDSAFNVRGDGFAVGEQIRKTRLTGGGLEGPLVFESGNQWWLNLNFSVFDILKDESRNSNRNPLDPAFDGAGEVAVYNDTGWETLDLKVKTDHWVGRDNMNFVAGYHYEHYRLGIRDYRSDDFAAGEKTAASVLSGGETLLQALFSQWGWSFRPDWDAVVGLRYERWRSEDGVFNDFSNGIAQTHEDRSNDRLSPKFSLGYDPQSPWLFRYSLAKAYRFPIVEELYQNERRTNNTVLANANLEPEDGLHHNLLLEREIDDGYLRFNVFYETIEDVIFNQSTLLPGGLMINTFLPIDEVSTRGLEFIANREHVMGGKADIRFNAAYVDARITENSVNPEVEGKDFPRMPEWRANLLLIYHINDRWDASGGLRYASNSFGDLDNSDDQAGVFGAHDSYMFLNVKAVYKFSQDIRVAFGVDNLTDETAFVHHPWPSRTFFLETSITL